MKIEGRQARTARRWAIICLVTAIICFVVGFFAILQKQEIILVAMIICGVLQLFNFRSLWRLIDEEKNNHRRF